MQDESYIWEMMYLDQTDIYVSSNFFWMQHKMVVFKEYIMTGVMFFWDLCNVKKTGIACVKYCSLVGEK